MQGTQLNKQRSGFSLDECISSLTLDFTLCWALTQGQGWEHSGTVRDHNVQNCLTCPAALTSHQCRRSLGVLRLVQWHKQAGFGINHCEGCDEGKGHLC